MTGCGSSREKNVDFSIQHHSGAKQRPAIVFLHSDAGNKEQFDSAYYHLKVQGWSVLSFDRRGHGRSSMPKDARFGYVSESEDVFDVADEAGFERIALVGHSGGGAVAFKAANDRPDRVAALLLVDPAPDPAVIPKSQTTESINAMRKDFKATIGEYYRSIAGPDPRIAEQIVATAKATPSATVIGLSEQIYEFKPRDYAARFTGPAHAIIQPQFDVEGALHRIQPGMTHEAIEGSGHWIHMAASEKFEASLDRFLTRLP